VAKTSILVSLTYDSDKRFQTFENLIPYFEPQRYQNFIIDAFHIRIREKDAAKIHADDFKVVFSLVFPKRNTPLFFHLLVQRIRMLPPYHGISDLKLYLKRLKKIDNESGKLYIFLKVCINLFHKRPNMESVYKVIELVGTSPKSFEEAAKNAVETAAKSLEDIRIAEVAEFDMKVEGGMVVSYRAKVKISFKYKE
jgi:flavin-binding protein dodecin